MSEFVQNGQTKILGDVALLTDDIGFQVSGDLLIDESGREFQRIDGSEVVTTDGAFGSSNDDILDGRNSTKSITLMGNGGDDTLIGGTANDILRGNGGNDTYVIRSHSAIDTIMDSNGAADLVVMEGSASSNATFLRYGNTLSIATENQTVEIAEYFGEDLIESIEFTDLVRDANWVEKNIVYPNGGSGMY